MAGLGSNDRDFNLKRVTLLLIATLNLNSQPLNPKP